MSKFQNWLLSKLPLLIPTRLPGIEYGSKRLSIQFGSQNNSTINPLDIRVKSCQNSLACKENVLVYSLSGKSPELQFTKRIKNTPIYLSCLSNERYNLYIVDFFEWIPFTTLYRALYFQSVIEDVHIELQFHDSVKKYDDQICQLKDWYFSYPKNTNLNLKGKKLAGSFSAKDLFQKLFIFSYSEDQSAGSDLSPEILTEKLAQLETKVTKNHILQCLKIQDIERIELIDELWFRQKEISPDRKINSHDTSSSIWKDELIRYMGWGNFQNARREIQIDYNEDKPESIKGILYDAYFKEKYDEEMIKNLIQKWWDQYSLPIFHLKLSKLIQTDVFLVFIIYSFALRMQLPWAGLLHQLANSFYHIPQLALLSYLFQIAMLKIEDNRSIKFIPGPGIKGNVGIVKRADIEYRQTRFGKVQFTSLSKQNSQFIKINKRVVLVHNRKLDHFTLVPHLISVSDRDLFHNPIVVEVDARFYQIPLVWKKAEITLPGCRIRWILKKERFQLTCNVKSSVSSLKIDDHVIDITHSNHVKFYYPVKKTDRKGIIQLYDDRGRSFVMQNDLSTKKVFLLGWLEDRYGLIAEKFNICIKSRQIPQSANESGFINTSFSLPADVDKIEVKSKHLSNIVYIYRIIDTVKVKLLTFHPLLSKGIILVVYDDKLGPIKKELEQFFHSTFGFTPLILSSEQITKSHNIKIMILVGEEKNLSQLQKKKAFANSLILPLRFPINTREFLRILSVND
jgi:hypothetical protein